MQFKKLKKENIMNSLNLNDLFKLKEILENKVVKNTDNISDNYQLAFLIMQLKPTIYDVERAYNLISPFIGLKIKKINRLNSIINLVLTNHKKTTNRNLDRINWSIYNKCPIICDGCYNDFRNKQLSILEIKEIVSKLKESKVMNITISGGDPLLWKDLYDFLEYTYSLGLQIGIDTVGFNLDKKLFFNENIKYIGLPLDSINKKIQFKMRKSRFDFLSNFKENMNMINQLNVAIKINTMASKINLHTLCILGEYLNDNYNNIFWSIYQWSPIRAKLFTQQEFEITIAQFEEEVFKLKQKFPNLNINSKNNEERSFNHILIQNDGTVITFGQFYGEVFYLGNILEDNLNDMINNPLISRQSTKFKSSIIFQ